MKLYLGEILLGSTRLDFNKKWRIDPVSGAVAHILMCNIYNTEQEAANAVKMQIPEECRAFVKEIQ